MIYFHSINRLRIVGINRTTPSFFEEDIIHRSLLYRRRKTSELAFFFFFLFCLLPFSFYVKNKRRNVYPSCQLLFLSILQSYSRYVNMYCCMGLLRVRNGVPQTCQIIFRASVLTIHVIPGFNLFYFKEVNFVCIHP